MEACNRLQKVGPDGGGGGAESPLVRAHQGWPPRHHLHVVGYWLGLDHPYVCARPRFACWMGHLLILWCMICIMLCLMVYFDYNSLVFMYVTCKTVIPQYKWIYVNKKGICV